MDGCIDAGHVDDFGEGTRQRTHAKGRVCPADSEARAARAPNLTKIRILIVTRSRASGLLNLCWKERACRRRWLRTDETKRPGDPRGRFEEENRTGGNEWRWRMQTLDVNEQMGND